MARIRTIKPEVCTSRVVAKMTLRAQLLWERMWMFCDDDGRMDYHPSILKGQAFPLVEEMTADVIDSCIKELEEHRLIIIYDVGERTYIQVRSWAEHQRIKNPTESKLPPPPAITPKRGSPTPKRGKPTGKKGSPTPLEVGSRNKEVGIRKPPISPFAGFWSAYPKKVGRQAALKAWERIAPDEQLGREIIAAVDAQKTSRQWLKDEGQFIPHPTTWLNQRRWEDEGYLGADPPPSLAAYGRVDIVVGG